MKNITSEKIKNKFIKSLEAKYGEFEEIYSASLDAKYLCEAQQFKEDFFRAPTKYFWDVDGRRTTQDPSEIFKFGSYLAFLDYLRYRGLGAIEDLLGGVKILEERGGGLICKIWPDKTSFCSVEGAMDEAKYSRFLEYSSKRRKVEPYFSRLKETIDSSDTELRTSLNVARQDLRSIEGYAVGRNPCSSFEPFDTYNAILQRSFEINVPGLQKKRVDKHKILTDLEMGLTYAGNPCS